MSMRCAAAVSAVVLCVSGSALAQSIAVSIGVRETGSVAALGADGGTSGGIEWVNRDLNIVALDGGWHKVTFDLPNAMLLPFAGVDADGFYTTTRGTLEHIRFRNTDGLDMPLRFFIDDLEIRDATGAMTLIGWEEQSLGDEHVFRTPHTSGSTNQNLVMGVDFAGVVDTMAHSGEQSYQLDFQFVDNDPTRWLRLTTFDTDSGANPTIDFGGTVSFWIKGDVVPSPSGAAVIGLAGAVLLRRRR